MPIKETDIKKAGMFAMGLSTWDKFKYSYNEEVVPFGAGVMRGTDPVKQCKLMTTGGKFLGVAAFRNVPLGENYEYPVQNTVEIITSGQVWVVVAAAVVAGDVAACGASGKFAKTGTATYDDVNGVFETSASANGYAILNLK